MFPASQSTTEAERVIVWGAAGHALVIADALDPGRYRIAALFDNRVLASSPLPGIPNFTGLAGLDEWLLQHPFRPLRYVIAVGGDRGADRLQISQDLDSRGLEALTVRHCTSFVARDAAVGSGAQILARSAVCAGSSIGRQTIVNTSASVDHECSLGNGVHIGPGATLAGLVQVGECAMIGAGAVVLPRRRIGAHAIVGAGAVVTRDVPERAVVWGNPARTRRFVTPG